MNPLAALEARVDALILRSDMEIANSRAPVICTKEIEVKEVGKVILSVVLNDNGNAESVLAHVGKYKYTIEDTGGFTQWGHLLSDTSYKAHITDGSEFLIEANGTWGSLVLSITLIVNQVCQQATTYSYRRTRFNLRFVA